MFMSIITAAFTTIVLTSCSDDDIITYNINPAVATTNNDSISIQQVINDLTCGTHVDLSNYLMGDEGVPLQGFTAVFDHEDKDFDEASRTKTYYLIEINKETGEKMIFNSEYFTVAALNHFDGVQGGTTRGISDAWNSFTKWVGDKVKKVKDAICYVLGIDLTNETLNEEQCLKFYAALDKELSEIHKKYSKNANVMNPWMTKYVLEHKEDKMGIVTCDFAGFDGEFDGYFCNGSCLPKAVVETNRFRKKGGKSTRIVIPLLLLKREDMPRRTYPLFFVTPSPIKAPEAWVFPSSPYRPCGT